MELWDLSFFRTDTSSRFGARVASSKINLQSLVLGSVPAVGVMMRRNRLSFSLLSALGLCVACGNDTSMVPLAKHDKGSAGEASSDSGTGKTSDTGTAGSKAPGDAGTQMDSGSAQLDPAKPNVEIIAPAAAADPNTDLVITDPMVTVQCQVTKSSARGARNVDQSAVRILLFNPDDPDHPIAAAVTAQADNLFEADFNLADRANGPVTFRCEADDVGAPPLTGTAELDTFLDQGPSINIIEPVDASVHQLGSVLVKFEVDPDPLSSSDAEAAPQDIHLIVSGTEFDFDEDPTQAGLYTQNIDFGDTTLFPMEPTSAEIVVTATNGRTPDAHVRESKVSIGIDSQPPVITVKGPAYSSIVRGEVVLSITVTDASGVQADSVVGTILGTGHTLTHWTIKGDAYSEQFDTRSFDATLTQLTINIVARDKVGNEGQASHILRLDNVPPLVSLDPPDIREFTVSNGHTYCSEPFDPVGADAVSDLDTVDVSSLYRVLVFEQTNHSPGENYGYVAGVNAATMTIYAQPDPSIPLLIDTDDDAYHVCDEINSEDLPLAQRPAFLALQPITVKGGSYFSSMSTFDSNWPAYCEAGMATTAPGPLCSGTAMTRVISQPLDGKPPAIYAFSPTNKTGANAGACCGNTWELLYTVGEGWACLAARVEDNIGNVGVSRPIRVCFDDKDPSNGTPDCDPQGVDVPTCVDNCALPQDLEAYQVVAVQ